MRKSALLALALLLAGISSARAEGSLTIGNVDPSTKYIVERVEPGDAVERHVRVGNTTPDALPVSVYASAATNRRGQFRWADGEATNVLTRWTTVSPAHTTVPSQRAVDVTVTIRVPDDTPLGRHYAVVWAELPRSDTGVVNRVGMRIYLTVVEPADSKTGLVLLVVALAAVLVVSGLAVATRRRGTGRADSTAASPPP